MSVMDNLNKYTQVIFSKRRIFSQTDEPDEKTGLWLKTSDKYDNIIRTDDDIYEQRYTWKSPSRLGTLPFKLDAGCGISYHGEIHLLGSWCTGYGTCHYKWDGIKWIEVSVLPYNFLNGSVVVYNDEIHMLGGSAPSADTDGTTSNETGYNHYKWDGTSWVSVSTLPYNFYAGKAVVFNNEIHILGSMKSGNGTKHYKWDGSTWSSVSTLPYNAYYHSCVIFNNEIHILSSQYNSSTHEKHYKWNGSTWSSVSTLPYSGYRASACVINDNIHLMGSHADESDQIKHYKWNGSTWSSVSTLPIRLGTGVVVELDDGFMICGGSFANTETAEYTKSVKTEYEPHSILFIQGSVINYSVNISVDYTSTRIIHENVINCSDIKVYGENYIMSIPIFIGNGTQWIGLN